MQSREDCSAQEWAEATTVIGLREKEERGQHEHKLRQKSAGQVS